MTRDDYYYGVPSTYAGYIAGKYMFEQAKAKGWDPKKTVGIFMDLSAFTACTMRLEGYKKALDEVLPTSPRRTSSGTTRPTPSTRPSRASATRSPPTRRTLLRRRLVQR